MATRLLHLSLSVEALDSLHLTSEETLQFLTGAIIPDAVGTHHKTETHFNKGRWSAGYDPRKLDDGLKELPIWLKNGWEVHLELDRLWQKICLRAIWYRVPDLLLRFGPSAARRYYEELSGFDILFRNALPADRLANLKTVVKLLQDYRIPDHLFIDKNEWKAFLNRLEEDLQKETTYSGPPIIGRKRFERFCCYSRQRIGERIREMSGDSIK